MIQGKGFRLNQQIERNTVKHQVRPDELSEIQKWKSDVEQADDHCQAHLETENNKQPDKRLHNACAESDEKRVGWKEPVELIEMPCIDHQHRQLRVKNLDSYRGVDQSNTVENSHNQRLILFKEFKSAKRSE